MLNTSSRRGISGKRMTVIEFLTLATNRNHVVKAYETGKKNLNHVPKQSRASFLCGKCGHTWTTKVQVYAERSSPSMGCRNCYTLNQQNPFIYPNSPFRSNPNTTKPNRRSGINALRQAHQQGLFGQIQNRADLIQYLSQQTDNYSQKVLPLLQRDDSMKSQGQSLQGPTSKHHVIPLHSGGSPDAWNWIEVTKFEHHVFHGTRFEVFGESGDLKATFGTQSDWILSLQQSAGALPQAVTVQAATPRGQHMKQRVPPELEEAFKRGMVWTHSDGTVITLAPNSVDSTPALKTALIQALPVNHPSRLSLEKNPTSVNYLRALIITQLPLLTTIPVSKKTYSAYGFTVSYFS